MSNTATATTTRVKLKQVSLFQVLLHNDDYTPMEFVTEVLMQFFGKTKDEAEAVMLAIHQKGIGVAGVYTKEIATQKANETMKTAKLYGHPLKASIKEA
jgi:ATP-dependent Clp protease adaptor protein ClpS